jgi:hypothetical protein
VLLKNILIAIFCLLIYYSKFLNFLRKNQISIFGVKKITLCYLKRKKNKERDKNDLINNTIFFFIPELFFGLRKLEFLSSESALSQALFQAGKKK